MQGSKAYLLTEFGVISKRNGHSRLKTFIDLLEASGCEPKYSREIPCAQVLREVDMVFVDCELMSHEQLREHQIFHYKGAVKIIFFNAPNDLELEVDILKCGATGFFYRDDKLDVILKGINCCRNGQRWFRRAALESLIGRLLYNENTRKVPMLGLEDDVSEAGLTKRERTIVSLVGKGAQNQEIADTLHISVNTVKTHIYSIFRKTNCRNRVELMTWSIYSNDQESRVEYQ
ncbi:response regulator transcription factor [Aestuariibacter sp. AA17]|uniref:Response regulator transcription factor n=1 Tax=Fluctibacter corallii TaxID=2984329 RepID=A0ABT3A9Q4_9ALTE|nr:response regulator transcription factor [Aestuariibacter sp. AA17]MCV2885046.1 response regulator transcription factor [Aestuariibacter sp. AA17]